MGKINLPQYCNAIFTLQLEGETESLNAKGFRNGLFNFSNIERFTKVLMNKPFI